MRETDFFWDRMAERKEETIKALKLGLTPPAIRIAVILTTGCNMSCIYCNERKKPFAVMQPLFFKSLCERVGSKGVIHISGGEPLIVPWLEDAILYWNRYRRFALNSNLLLRPSDNMLKYLFRVKTSLDDWIPERWNEIVGGKFFQTVVENIKYVSDRVQYTSVSYCATHKNAGNLAAFLHFCNREFPNLYSTSVSFYKGSDLNLQLTKEDVSVLFAHAQECMNEISWQVFYETHNQQGNFFPDNLKLPCYLAMTERTFDPHGVEYLCSHLYRDGVEPPGRPGEDIHCVTGCNQRFVNFNREVHNAIS